MSFGQIHAESKLSWHFLQPFLSHLYIRKGIRLHISSQVCYKAPTRFKRCHSASRALSFTVHPATRYMITCSIRHSGILSDISGYLPNCPTSPEQSPLFLPTSWGLTHFPTINWFFIVSVNTVPHSFLSLQKSVFLDKVCFWVIHAIYSQLLHLFLYSTQSIFLIFHLIMYNQKEMLRIAAALLSYKPYIIISEL